MTKDQNLKPFAGQAHHYAKYRPAYPDRMYQFIFRHLEQTQKAWDCGTGSGQVAAYLAGHFEKVFATDISPEQLEHAAKRKNIEYMNVPAEKNHFPKHSFDLITVAQAIHWFDFGPFYREVKRTGKEGSLLAVIGYGKLRISSEIDPVIRRLYDLTFTRYFSECRKYVNEEYRTIPFPFEEIPSPRFTIRYHWNTAQIRGFFDSWSSIQKFKSEEGSDPAEETMKAIRRHIPPGESAEVRFPVFLRLAKIRQRS